MRFFIILNIFLRESRSIFKFFLLIFLNLFIFLWILIMRSCVLNLLILDYLTFCFCLNVWTQIMLTLITFHVFILQLRRWFYGFWQIFLILYILIYLNMRLVTTLGSLLNLLLGLQILSIIINWINMFLCIFIRSYLAGINFCLVLNF